MTILYRSPDFIVDQHEWHVIVRLEYERVCTSYRWRPLTVKKCMWKSLGDWVGPRPHRIRHRFWKYRFHIRDAMNVPTARAEALAKIRRPNGAMLRNGGEAGVAI